MQEIRFVAVAEFGNPEYQRFSELTKYDTEHPLHMLHDYVVQYYGGLRKDVLLLFCDEKRREALYSQVGSNPEAGVRNEWYRRFVRLLQCNASAEWYEMYCMDVGEKTDGYRQYFNNQLVVYAEQGYEAERVKNIFLECDAAYLLEYQIRQSKLKMDIPDEVDNEICEEVVSCEEKTSGTASQESSQEQINLLAAVLEGQRQIRNMLENVLNKPEMEKGIEVSSEIETDETELETAQEEIGYNQEAVLEETGEQSVEEESKEVMMLVPEKEKAFRIASLFQQIRLKRKSIQLRKLEPKLQMQELALLMKNKAFSPAAMKLVRNLIDYDVSLEFLYTIIAEGKNAENQLQLMYEFISYQPNETTE